MSDCGRYLIVTAQKECRDNLVFFADLEALPNGIEGPIAITPVVDKLEHDYDVRRRFGQTPTSLFIPSPNVTAYHIQVNK